jgi:hypothetical protein
MPLTIRPYRHFPAHGFVTCNAELLQGQGTVWSVSYPDWRLSGNIPTRQRETLSLTIMLSKEQSIRVPEAGERWSK